MTSISVPKAALCQVLVVAAAIVVAALWPPRQGAMLMIPLSGRSVEPIDIARDADAALLAVGPLPGSMIVIGRRAALSGPAWRHGILLMSAPRALCGDRSAGAAA